MNGKWFGVDTMRSGLMWFKYRPGARKTLRKWGFPPSFSGRFKIEDWFHEKPFIFCVPGGRMPLD